MSIPLSQPNKVVLLRDNFTCQSCGATGAEVGGRELLRVGYLARNDESVKKFSARFENAVPRL